MLFAQLRYAEKQVRQGGERSSHWATVAERLRVEIVGANLALVLAITRRYGYGDELEERIGQGNFALERAVRCFDPFRGFAFSTYASRAMIKAFSKSRFVQAKRAAKGRAVLYPGAMSVAAGDAVRSVVAHRAARAAELEEDRREDAAAQLRAAIEAADLSEAERFILTRMYLDADPRAEPQGGGQGPRDHEGAGPPAPRVGLGEDQGGARGSAGKHAAGALAPAARIRRSPRRCDAAAAPASRSDGHAGRTTPTG